MFGTTFEIIRNPSTSVKLCKSQATRYWDSVTGFPQSFAPMHNPVLLDADTGRRVPQGTAGYRRVVASTLCPQHSTAPGDFYKHTAPEQGSQFGATFLMQMLLGTKFAIVVLPNDFVLILLQGLSCTLPGASLGPHGGSIWDHRMTLASLAGLLWAPWKKPRPRLVALKMIWVGMSLGSWWSIPLFVIGFMMFHDEYDEYDDHDCLSFILYFYYITLHVPSDS